MTKVSGPLSPPPPAAIAKALEIEHLTIDWLAGDGSDRCYFRIRSHELERSLVLMQLSGADAANLLKGRYDWVEISELLRSHKIAAPRCVATLAEHSAIIIDDYGDAMLETLALNCAKNSKINDCLSFFRSGLETIGQFLSIQPTPGAIWTSRAFDQERFEWELRFFVTKYLGPVAHYSLSSVEEAEFGRDVRALSNFLAVNSRYFVHRDFHSRNIMVHEKNVAVIDFQDARLGPAAYDLVSLVFDSYVPLLPATRIELLEEGFEVIKKLAGEEASTRARTEWRPMLLQRQLKAIGSFGYLTVDKHKGDYIKNVAPALQTLFDADVQDARWPFISGKLLHILAKTLPDRTPILPVFSATLKMAPA
jgi:aminoglycoside/choline kinase family phosphotransferase